MATFFISESIIDETKRKRKNTENNRPTCKKKRIRFLDHFVANGFFNAKKINAVMKLKNLYTQEGKRCIR
jgi:hypothetical protein